MEAMHADAVVYPDSDGERMADNTLQFDWIVLLKENLDAVLPDFVAGDLLWYPVEGDPRTRRAPDVLVARGRPKGYRGSYRTWDEDGVAPTAVFEVLSPSNTAREMLAKVTFYARHGAREIYILDPEEEHLQAFFVDDAGKMSAWEGGVITSPALGVRFEHTDGALCVYAPDGTRFMSMARLCARATARADAEAGRAERLAAALRELGVDPDALG